MDFNVKMMPFLMDCDFEKSKLAEYLHFGRKSGRNEMDKIGSLSIEEKEKIKEDRDSTYNDRESLISRKEMVRCKYRGDGSWDGVEVNMHCVESWNYGGGIYAASNMEKSCK